MAAPVQYTTAPMHTMQAPVQYTTAPVHTMQAPVQYSSSPVMHTGAPVVQSPMVHTMPAMTHAVAAPQIMHGQPIGAPVVSHVAASPMVHHPGMVHHAGVAVSAAPAHYVIPQSYLPAGLVLHPSTKAAYQQLQAQIPWQKERLAERQHLFAICDAMNGNGFLSFAEVEANLNTQLHLEQVVPDCKMVLMKVFNEAKHWGGQQGGHGPDYVEKREFRIFLELLHKELDRLVGPDTDPHD